MMTDALSPLAPGRLRSVKIAASDVCPATGDEHVWTSDVDVPNEHLRGRDRVHCDECGAVPTDEQWAEWDDEATSRYGKTALCQYCGVPEDQWNVSDVRSYIRAMKAHPFSDLANAYLASNPDTELADDLRRLRGEDLEAVARKTAGGYGNRGGGPAEGAPHCPRCGSSELTPTDEAQYYNEFRCDLCRYVFPSEEAILYEEAVRIWTPYPTKAPAKWDGVTMHWEGSMRSQAMYYYKDFDGSMYQIWDDGGELVMESFSEDTVDVELERLLAALPPAPPLQGDFPDFSDIQFESTRRTAAKPRYYLKDTQTGWPGNAYNDLERAKKELEAAVGDPGRWELWDRQTNEKVAAKEDTAMTHPHREAQLLEALEYATPREAARITTELDGLRRAANLRRETGRALDWDAVHSGVPGGPVPPGLHTAASDWMSDTETPVNPRRVKQAAIREARHWLLHVDPIVLREPAELEKQALDHAEVWSSGFANSNLAHRTFVSALTTLLSPSSGSLMRMAAGDGTSGQDRDSYSDTQDRDSYTVDEERTEEDEKWWKEYQESLKGRKSSRRRTAADDDSSDDSGGATCSVCGASIERDPEGEEPRTWHHNDGESHDHEASPSGGDSKESRRRRRRTAASPDLSAIEQWCDTQGLVMKDFPDSLIDQAAETGDTSILEAWLDAGNEPLTVVQWRREENAAWSASSDAYYDTPYNDDRRYMGGRRTAARKTAQDPFMDDPTLIDESSDMYQAGVDDARLDIEGGTYYLPPPGSDDPNYQAGYLSLQEEAVAAAEDRRMNPDDYDGPVPSGREDFYSDI